jgi:arginyl-tRNA synthetase
VKQTLTDLINDAWVRAAEAGALPDVAPPVWRLELPNNPDHGDFASNIALVGAKTARMAPRKIAEAILSNMGEADEIVRFAEIAGPGFINIRLNHAQWQKVLVAVEAEGDAYGRGSVGEGKKVQVEFVSANPTGPLHVGHGRGAAVGDVLARILDAAGFTVEREYYVNDAGNQIATLGGSIYLRYLELFGREVEFPDTYYQGDYIAAIASDVRDDEGDRYLELPQEEAIDILGRYAGARILSEIREDLAAFGVVFDEWFSEQSLFDNGDVAESLKKLEESGSAYRSEGALWLRTSEYGDEKDRVLVRSDGRETYFASDISYHLNKFNRGFDEVIDIWGSDHHGYVPRMKAALDTVGRDSKALHILMVQFVNLLRDGEQVSMSTRAGQFVRLAEVCKEVGVDATRFMFLSRNCDQTLDFDLEVAKRQTADNPVFYVQYAGARICSVLAGAKAEGVTLPAVKDADLSPLTNDEEMEILRLINFYPDMIEDAALKREPHKLAYYLQELAAKFHQYYNKYRFLTDEQKVTVARLCLIDGVRRVLKNGLTLMGITVPEKM